MLPLLLLLSCAPEPPAVSEEAASPAPDASTPETSAPATSVPDASTLPAAPVEGYRVASSEDQVGPWTNRLAAEPSRYLQLHAHNPVDWWPWGEAAFAEAARRDVPVFLSIGYATCHWCHVMAEESFEDPVVAAFLNERFVCVKVDKEESPDVDAVYMQAVVQMSGSGGWPASLWLLPDKRPFHAGTYFPREASHGRPAFAELLRSLDEVWRTDRARVEAVATELQRGLVAAAVVTPSAELPQGEAVERSIDALLAGWDATNQGWGSKKFPEPARLEWMLAYALARPGEPRAEEVVAHVRGALDAMDRGGLHDHLGGGFHRYTVDRAWKKPHFEKILETNAQLLRLYAEAAVALDEPRYAAVARDVAAYLLRELRDEQTGAFYIGQDADSEGKEGAFYLWTPERIRAALPPEQAEALIAAYGVTEEGSFSDGTSVLVRGAVDPDAAPLPEARAALFRARAERVPPALDDRLVVAFNGLAISGLARGGRLLDESTWIRAAQQAARSILAARGEEGQLPRALGPRSREGALDDYVFFAEGLLDLYEADGDPDWLWAADRLARGMVSRFEDPVDGGFFHFAEPLTGVHLKIMGDGQEPASNAHAGLVVQRLQAYGAPWIDPGTTGRVLRSGGAVLDESPHLASSMALLLDGERRPSLEVVLVAPAEDLDALAPFVAAYGATWRPHGVLARATPERVVALEGFATLDGKVSGDGTPRAYVCFDGACRQPTEDVSTFAAQLAAPAPSRAP